MPHTCLQRLEATLFLTLADHLPVESMPAIRHAVEDAIQQPWLERVVINLRQATFLDSTGIGLLVAAKRWTALHGKRLFLTQPCEQIMKTLHLVHLADSFFYLDHCPECDQGSDCADSPE
ncbi:STAS domain-containing protein [Megalodesulfovibrio paquesii]